MKKVLFGLCALAMLSFTSCQLMDQIFYRADEVKASDLGSFTGDVASSKDDVKNSALGMTGTMLSVNLPAPAKAQLLKLSPGLSKLLSEPASFDSMLSRYAVSSSVASKAINVSDKSDPDNGKYDYAATYTDESFGENGLNVNGSVAYKFDVTSSNSTATIDGNAAADIKATMAAIDNTPFKGAKVNAKGKVDGKVTETYSTTSYTVGAKVYTAIAINGGFAMDSWTDDSTGTTYKGGKFVVSLRYIDNIDVSDASATDYASDASKVDISLEVKVYDNSNNLKGSYTFTNSDIAS